jgi:hypothetical protein
VTGELPRMSESYLPDPPANRTVPTPPPAFQK